MKICEVCGKEHDGSYGSRRFCSKRCKMSYISQKSIEKRRRDGTLNELMARTRAGLTKESFQKMIATRKSKYSSDKANFDLQGTTQRKTSGNS